MFPPDTCNFCGDIATQRTAQDNPLCDECFSSKYRHKAHIPSVEDLYLKHLDEKLARKEKMKEEKLNDKY